MTIVPPKTPEEKKAFVENMKKRKERIRKLNKAITEFNNTIAKDSKIKVGLIDLNSWAYH